MFRSKILLLALSISALLARDTINNSVVKIYATINKPDQMIPWQSKGAHSVTGSGVLIDDQYILTCAHVVNHASYIEVKNQNGIKKYHAVLKHISLANDLALIKVKKKEFYNDLVPLEIASTPKLQEEVRVLGYPKGGKELSITKGIISRIEYSPYAMSNKDFLSIQIDAAINAGNSGGPVLNSQNEIVGIAMQGLSKYDSEGISYIVPPTVINHFLKDMQDGKIDGMVGHGFIYQKLINESLKNYYTNNKNGILIAKVLKGSYATKILQAKDIILKIDKHQINSDGTYSFKDNINISFEHIIHSKQVGDSISFTILREGKSLQLKTTIESEKTLVPSLGTQLRYYIYGGLIIRPVTYQYMQALEFRVPTKWYEYIYSKQNQPVDGIDELVFIQGVLPNSLNSGYINLNNMIIEKINGIQIKSLDHLVKFISSSNDKYIVFDLHNHTQVVFEKSIADKKITNTLQNYHIASDRDLGKSI